MDEETQIGKLNKDYTGFINEMFTVADSFTIQCEQKFVCLIYW